MDQINHQDIEFNPITEGLGFNQEKYKGLQKEVKINTKISPSENIKSEVYRPLKKEQVTFKKDEIKKIKTINTKEAPKAIKQSFEGIRVFKKLLAWMIDLVVVLGSVLILSILVNYLITQNFEFTLIQDINFWTYFIAPLFFASYIFYFSVFLKTTKQTMGMHILDLEIVSKSGEDVTFYQTILRSVLGMVSVMTFGIFEILGLVNALTWTEIKSSKIS